MKKDKKNLYKKSFMIFFVLMIFLTLMTRMLDSVMIPKVQISAYASGSLSYRIEGAGVVKASEASYVDIPEGVKVDGAVSCGDRVEDGQGVIFLRITDLEDKKKELQHELNKMQLALEQEQLRGKSAAGVTQQEQLKGRLELEEKKISDAAAGLQSAEEEYIRGSEEMRKKKDRETSYARQQLSSSREEIERMNRGLDQEDKRSYSQAELEFTMTVARIEEEYESALKQLEGGQWAAVLKLNNLQNAYNELLYDMELAAKRDESTLKNERNAEQISKKAQEIQRIDIEAKREDIQAVEELLLADGQVRSIAEGVVTKMGVIPGSVTVGNEIVEIGKGKYLFCGKLSAEDSGLLEEGDTVELSMPTEPNMIKGTISGISMDSGSGESETDPEGNALFTAVLEDGEYRIGSTAEYTVSKNSKRTYSCLIPLSAVREDGGGRYCLIAEENSTILGEEDIAVRINLEIMGTDRGSAAVNAVLTGSDRIIIGSNKSIREGDRVRIQP